MTVEQGTYTSETVMKDYTYGGSVPTPSVTNDPEETEVTYYYNIENSNVGGTKWENITPTTLPPGTYYLYAQLEETASYKACITEPTAFEVKKAEISIVSAAAENRVYDGTDQVEITGIDLEDAVSGTEVSVDLTDVKGTIGDTHIGSYAEVTLPADLALKGADAECYELTDVRTVPLKPEVEISKATITISAEDCQAKVGEPIPTFTYRTEGLLGEDKLYEEPEFSCELTGIASKAGTYEIQVSGADAGSDYEIIYRSGTLTVGKQLIVEDIPDQFYTGSPLQPALVVTDGWNIFDEGEYTVTYKDNIELGTATVTVEADGYKDIPDRSEGSGR